jgi:hypothetical protein
MDRDMKLKAIIEHDEKTGSLGLTSDDIRAALRIYFPGVKFTVSEVTSTKKTRVRCYRCNRKIAIKKDGSFFKHKCQPEPYRSTFIPNK